MTDQQLIAEAAEVRRKAYAPFSKFQVGAALETAGGHFFKGCNVENSSFGLSFCAERNAIGAMVAAVGSQSIRKIAIVANRLAPPCGACRQVIVEFGTDVQIIAASADDLQNVKRWTICELIPDYFKL